jgi:hypothetical protein
LRGAGRAGVDTLRALSFPADRDAGADCAVYLRSVMPPMTKMIALKATPCLTRGFICATHRGDPERKVASPRSRQPENLDAAPAIAIELELPGPGAVRLFIRPQASFRWQAEVAHRLTVEF